MPYSAESRSFYISSTSSGAWRGQIFENFSFDEPIVFGDPKYSKQDGILMYFQKKCTNRTTLVSIFDKFYGSLLKPKMKLLDFLNSISGASVPMPQSINNENEFERSSFHSCVLHRGSWGNPDPLRFVYSGAYTVPSSVI